MKCNKLLKIMCSIPVVLILLYFIPFLGICLTLFRLYFYKNKKYFTPVILIIIGILLLIPKLLILVVETFKISLSISYLNNIMMSDVYYNLINYSKLLISFGLILILLSVMFRSLYYKLNDKIKSYINNIEKRNTEISRKNDMIIKEKQEKAKNTHVVFCPYCGADNMLTQRIGICKYCRRKIEYKETK